MQNAAVGLGGRSVGQHSCEILYAVEARISLAGIWRDAAWKRSNQLLTSITACARPTLRGSGLANLLDNDVGRKASFVRVPSNGPPRARLR